MSDKQEPQLPSVKLIPLMSTWTCPNCRHQNGISAANLDDKAVQCTACAQWVRPGIPRADLATPQPGEGEKQLNRLADRIIDAVYNCIQEMGDQQIDGRKNPIWWLDNLKAKAKVKILLRDSTRTAAPVAAGQDATTLVVRADQITELNLGNEPWIKVVLPTDADYENAVRVLATKLPTSPVTEGEQK